MQLMIYQLDILKIPFQQICSAALREYRRLHLGRSYKQINSKSHTQFCFSKMKMCFKSDVAADLDKGCETRLHSI